MKKINPPVLFMICILFILFLRWLFPVFQFVIYPMNVAGTILLIAGLAIAKLGADHFEKVGTNIETFDEPDALVTDGLFRISRNPMYLGFLTALAGISFLTGCLSSLIIVVLFFVITDRWYIAFEETEMLKKFGDSYAQYRMKTRRWL